MPAGTCFVADIRPVDKRAIDKDWWQAFRSHFEKNPVLTSVRLINE